MSSQDIATYLDQLSHSERKLEYSRQMLAANSNFLPQFIFNYSQQSNNNRNTLSKKQFVELIKNLNMSFNQEEIQTIFNYFQLDSKPYLNSNEFTTLILPQNDQLLNKLVNKRKLDELEIDYSLQYALQKYLLQIIENQLRVDTFNKLPTETSVNELRASNQAKSKRKKLDVEGLRQFLNSHGRYPNDTAINLVLQNLRLNNVNLSKNKIVVDFITEFNLKGIKRVIIKQKTSINNVILPKPTIQNKQSVAAVVQKENVSNSSNQNAQRVINLNLSNNPNTTIHKVASPSLTLKPNSISQSNKIQEVENKIKQLMGSINSYRPKKQQYNSAQKFEVPINRQEIKQLKFSKDQNLLAKQAQRQIRQQQTPYHRLSNTKLDSYTPNTAKKSYSQISYQAPKQEKYKYQFDKKREIKQDHFDNESNHSPNVAIKQKGHISKSKYSSSLQDLSRENEILKRQMEAQKLQSLQRINYLKSVINEKEAFRNRR